MMQKGDFVYISYVGRIKETGEIFDLTSEEIAKKEGIYNPEVRYGDIPIIVGAGFLLPGLEEEIEKMNVGERKIVELEAKKAFGERREDLIKLIPETEFKRQNIEPRVGEFVNVNGIMGRILSVNAGRVRVDFNHPLAGKNLVYEIEIKKQVTDLKEKIYAILKYFANLDENLANVKIENDLAEIEVKNLQIANKVKENIVNTIFNWIKEIKKVKFSEVFEKKQS
ncbi:MAG: FKBP-type peptidyl-prolyl cis-trans isomerase [Candidatus Aenigmatarchaeota archaeon]|jgi:FKBP-type peptidyl-prolyl cis-trans isomerase 2